MGSKAQRRKERHERKRQEKRKKARGRQQPTAASIHFAVGSNARHRQRLAEQLPRAWSGETQEDVAIFDDKALANLPTDLAEQVVAVRKALEHASASRADDALQSTSSIPRSSPLSEWRIFIRGFVDWLSGNTEAARETWTRLNPERRPGRIATAMTLALREDLEQLAATARKAESNGAEDPEPSAAAPLSRWDSELVNHAHLLRRVRIDRPALRVAQAGLKVPEEARELLLGPRKLKWLRLFVQEYIATEPELTAAIAQAALRRAFVQQFSDIFDEAVKTLPGPRHDRRNRLLTFFFYGSFDDDDSAEESQRSLEQYLDHDLPQNEELTEDLRNAITSMIHFYEAVTLLKPPGMQSLIESLFGPPEDSDSIHMHFHASLQAYPKNQAAHNAYADWLQAKIDNDRLKQSERKSYEAELAEVMRGWSQELPEDVEPRLWLIDYLLENELLEEARPHIDFLASSRQEDPRVRAMPWKWQILEAMRLCRRKAWLAEVPARLDEAESMWPAWLPKQWLPYLRAAWLLRCGQVEEMEKHRQEICATSGLARDSLADACMMLGAAQQMRVPAEDLKRLRAPIEQALTRLATISNDELHDAGAFFWDLHRTKLVYPAYRMQGGKIGQALVNRWNESKAVPAEINEERFLKTLLWCSECRFWSASYDIRLPSFYSEPGIEKHPMLAAAKLNSFIRSSMHWGWKKYRHLGPQLREAAQSERDVFYRYWFVSLAEKLDEVQAELASNRFGGIFHDEDDDN